MKLFVSTILLLVLTHFSHARTWTQASTGRTIDGELVQFDGKNAIIRRAGGQTVTIPVSMLAEADQEFIRNKQKSAGQGGAKSTDWPAFRGADQTDISPDKGLLKSWPSEGPPKSWVFKDAGMGYAGYSIVGSNLFTMGVKSGKVHMICVNIEDGSEVWSRSFADDDGKGYNAGWGGGPRGTPTYSDGKLYGLGPKGVLACLNVDGKKEWSVDLIGDFDGKAGTWGYSSSPLVDGDKVIVAPGGSDAGIVALDKNSGKVIWKAEEVKPGKAEYATILVTELNGTRQYIKFFEKIIASVDAESGELLWQADFPNGRTAVIPTPIIEGNQLYVTAGYGAGCRAFEINSDNKVELLWENKNMVNHHGGVVKYGDHLYGISDGKGMVCQDWKSGEITWMHKDGQFIAKGASHIAEGMIYALNEQNGALSLIEASPEGFTQKGQFVMDPQSPNRPSQGRVWTHPVVIGGKLFLRDQEYIVCYDVKD